VQQGKVLCQTVFYIGELCVVLDDLLLDGVSL
jgi:hypothetical protein